MRNRLSRLSRRTRWTLAIFAGTIVVAVLLSFFIDEPLRRSVERQMNAHLTGYSVSIGKLRFHPIGLSLTLSDLVFTQQANPDPPIGRIPRLDASVQWRALLSWKLVANFALRSPEALRQPRASPVGGRRSRAGGQARLAGGVSGHLPLEDQPVHRSGTGRPPTSMTVLSSPSSSPPSMSRPTISGISARASATIPRRSISTPSSSSVARSSSRGMRISWPSPIWASRPMSPSTGSSSTTSSPSLAATTWR